MVKTDGASGTVNIEECERAVLVMNRLIEEEGAVGLALGEDCDMCLRPFASNEDHDEMNECLKDRLDELAYLRRLIEKLNSGKLVVESLRRARFHDEFEENSGVERALRDVISVTKDKLFRFAAAVESEYLDSSEGARRRVHRRLDAIRNEFIEEMKDEGVWQNLVNGEGALDEENTSFSWSVSPPNESILERRAAGLTLESWDREEIESCQKEEWDEDELSFVSTQSRASHGGASNRTEEVSSRVVRRKRPRVRGRVDRSVDEHRPEHSHSRRVSPDRRVRVGSSGRSPSRRRRSPSRRRRSPSRRRRSPSRRRRSPSHRRRSHSRRRRSHSKRRHSSSSGRLPHGRRSLDHRSVSTASDRKVEAVITPAVAAPVGAEDVYVYPGMDEPETGVTLTHLKGGPFMGG